MLHFKYNIRLIRLISGLSQTKFGEKFSATKAMIVSYESGKAGPDELFISRLAKYAGVKETDLKNRKLSEPEIQVKPVVKSEKGEIEIPDSLQFLSEKVLLIEAGMEVERSLLIDLLARATGKTTTEIATEVAKALDYQISKRRDELQLR